MCIGARQFTTLPWPLLLVCRVLQSARGGSLGTSQDFPEKVHSPMDAYGLLYFQKHVAFQGTYEHLFRPLLLSSLISLLFGLT